MVSLRDQGRCPCPLCETPKELISELGMKRDRERRVNKARKDTASLDSDILRARNAIYGQHAYKVNSKHVDNILKERSRIPTIVGAPQDPHFRY